jgi:hypothetical protein
MWMPSPALWDSIILHSYSSVRCFQFKTTKRLFFQPFIISSRSLFIK